ncbi:hypothetical protein Ahy_A05g023524 [Arachis hypogaea]|uniref:Aminotransferase-like plant mobile domain-containing protein n=1 Tax=Arachis hypogaea TaxID=3818 RepID=A0A445D3N7_ARAHY|nr:hypothetical protein Ahy_A05g023524 [Arachis hypogaea]
MTLKLRMLTCDHPVPPDRYNDRVEEHLRFGVAPSKSECRGCCIKLTWLRDLKENIQLTDEISIQRWRNWERGDRRYRYLNLAHFRKAFDDLQEGQFVWVAYAVDRVDPNIIPAEIYMQSVVWTATVPLVSFECVEWHATDRFRRQFGFLQGVPSEERSLDKAHGEVLTGPKNLNWATTPTHSSWVMHWTNRYNYILSELPINSPHPLETYMQWYRSKYGNRDEDNQDIDEGNEVMDEDNEGMDDDNEELDPQLPQTSISNPQTQEQPQFSSQYVPQTQFYPSFPMHQQYWGMSQFDPGEGGSFSQLLGFMAGDAGQSQYGNEAEILAGRYSLDARLPCHTSSVASGGFVSVDFSRSEGGRGVLNSQNPNRVSMGPVQEDANTPEDDTNAYIVDEMEEDVDDDEDEIEEFDEDEDEESRNDGQAHTPDDKGKGYNLRIDPPRRSANRYTPSVFKKAAKKCKNFVNDVKWALRK